MAFDKRRELLFIYSVKDANPNGDPLNANHPRYDAETSRVLVSDVRIKRTIRDQWIKDGFHVFVDGEAKTLKGRIDELKQDLNVKSGREALGKCIDTRLFGVTYAHDKESFSWTGPVQFKWGRSLHRAKAELIQGTAAFATKEGAEQRSFRNEYIIPFVLIAVYGIANQYASKDTGATEQDVDEVKKALWKGTTNLITRSKVGHAPRVLIEIMYQSGFDGAVGSLDEKVKLLSKDGTELTEDQEYSLRSPKEFILDIYSLVERMSNIKNSVEKVSLITDTETKIKGLDELVEVLGKKLVHEVR
ncbi:MAG: type I-B CRISPR-associated protein Cas7/Csh2 [Firmicutes bacterium]|nr:type I-B CRISPR-associated protein Cas7/Csh2 [Bacillota bacterium]